MTRVRVLLESNLNETGKPYNSCRRCSHLHTVCAGSSRPRLHPAWGSARYLPFALCC